MSKPAIEARLLSGTDSVPEAEAAVQMEALVSLRGIEKPAADEFWLRLGAWNPRVVGVLGMPLEDVAEADDCTGAEPVPTAVSAWPCASPELGYEAGERAYRSSRLLFETVELPALER